MSSTVGRYRAFRASPHFVRIWKFAAVSLVATAVSQSLLFLFYPHIVSSAMGSNVIATAVSTVPAYYLNRRWTWGKRGKSRLWREVVPFWVIAFVGLVLSTVIVGIAAKNAGRISPSTEVKEIVVHVANLFAYGLIWVGRYTILNRFLFGPGTQAGGARVLVGAVTAEQPVAATATTASGSPAPLGSVLLPPDVSS